MHMCGYNIVIHFSTTWWRPLPTIFHRACWRRSSLVRSQHLPGHIHRTHHPPRGRHCCRGWGRGHHEEPREVKETILLVGVSFSPVYIKCKQWLLFIISPHFCMCKFLAVHIHYLCYNITVQKLNELYYYHFAVHMPLPIFMCILTQIFVLTHILNNNVSLFHTVIIFYQRQTASIFLSWLGGRDF